MRSALWALVDATSGAAPIGVTGDLRQTMMLLHFTQPALVLVDAALVGGPDLPDLATLHRAAPHAAIIVIGTGDHPSYSAKALEAGASDYVLLEDAADRLPEAILSAISALQR